MLQRILLGSVSAGFGSGVRSGLMRRWHVGKPSVVVGVYPVVVVVVEGVAVQVLVALLLV